MQVIKNNVSLEATPTSDTHVTNKGYVDGTVESLLDDTSTRSDRTWSSEEIAKKISKINVADAKKVDEKPTYSSGTITYVKDGKSYTTTNDKQWFYYLENVSLKQTIFIDGEELTIDGASVDFDEFVKKTSIVTYIDSTCTNEQVAGAKAVNTSLNEKVGKETVKEIPGSDTSKIKHIGIDILSSKSISGKTTRLFFSDDVVSGMGLQVWNGNTLEKDVRFLATSTSNLGKNLCLTNVDDVPLTTLTPVSQNVNFTNYDSECYYCVINGMCYVTLWSMNITANLSIETLFDNLPIAKAPAHFLLSNSIGSETVGMGWIGVGGKEIKCNAVLKAGATVSTGYARFSYPV